MKMSSRVVAVSLFACVAGSSAFGQSAPPQTNLNGQIFWDHYKIPHIYANTIEGALYGLGFAQMENHAETLLIKVGAARAKSAEYFGNWFSKNPTLKAQGIDSALLLNDIQAVNYDIPNRAKRWIAEGTQEQRDFIKSFCDGINAYADKNSGSILPIFRAVLPVKPDSKGFLIK